MNRRQTLAYARKQLPVELARMNRGGYASACPELTAAEKALIHKYSFNGSTALNQELHASGGLNDSAFGQGLASALARLPCYDGPIVRSGGYLSPTELLAYAIYAATEASITWPAFLSTSTSAAVAKYYLEHGNNVLFLITPPKTGRFIEELSYYGPHGPDPGYPEAEVLLLPNTRFNVLAVRPATSYTEIVLEEA